MVHAAVADPVRDALRTVVVQSHSIDQRVIFGEPEQPGPRISFRGVVGNRADLRKPEAEVGPKIDEVGVLVHSGGKANRIHELMTPERYFQGIVMILEHRPDELHRRRAGGSRREHGEAMRRLRTKPKQQGPECRIQG